MVTLADLTPGDCHQVQLHWLRRWLAGRCPRMGRRLHDLPLPPVVAHLSAGQVQRYCCWLATHTP